MLTCYHHAVGLKRAGCPVDVQFHLNPAYFKLYWISFYVFRPHLCTMSDPSPSTSNATEVGKPKRTARLGTTEIVSVPATKDNLEQLAAHADAQARFGVQGTNGFHPDGGSDDEDDGEGRGDYELEEGDQKVEDPDFLKDYPDTTEVSMASQYQVDHVYLINVFLSGPSSSTSKALE